MIHMFLPITRQDLIDREIDILDFIIVSGDAYVDHPSFGTAIIGRIVEREGYSVGIVAQPQCDEDYSRLGTPKHGFLIAGGVVDSMVNNYYSSLRRRGKDEYSEGGVYGKRPDRCVDVYAHNIRRLFGSDVAIVAGGLEASLRRLSHYDYWSDSVRQSILLTSGVDLVVYGMGENPIVDILAYIGKNVPLNKIKDVKGTAYLTTTRTMPKRLADGLAAHNDNILMLPSHDVISSDKVEYCKAFVGANNAVNRDKVFVLQYQDDDNIVVVNPIASPLTSEQMDKVYSLPFERAAHPIYKKGVPAIKEVEFSVTAHRGCYGNCSFCAITYHQGRVVQSRSEDNIISEVEQIAQKQDFKGYIHDIGGPSANFHQKACDKQERFGACPDKECIGIKKCNNLRVDHSKYLSILRRARAVKGVKKVFVRSGIRFDYIMEDMDRAFLDELVKYHVSGQLKVAPEHASNDVLSLMNKPQFETYLSFKKEFERSTKKCGLAKQYLVPYFISGHPGCTLDDAVVLTEYLKDIGYMPLQVQDFYPTPSTLATTMYYTELNPYTMQKLFVAKTPKDKAMQRALLQWRLPQNKALCDEAYSMVGNKVGSDKYNEGQETHRVGQASNNGNTGSKAVSKNKTTAKTNSTTRANKPKSSRHKKRYSRK